MTEICVQINGSFEDIKKAVIEKGYKLVESYDNYDTYFTTITKEKIKNTPYNVLLDNSIIVRNIVGDGFNIKNIVYKKKTFDDKGNVIGELKTKLGIDDISKAKNIFNNLHLFCWCDYVNQNNEYKKGEITLNIQYVKELGTFIEIEEFASIADKTDKEKFDTLVGIINNLGSPIGNDYSCKKPFMLLNKTEKCL